MKKLIVFICCCFSFHLFGQNVSGTIKDSETSENLIGANILIIENTDSTYTSADINGYFEFSAKTFPLQLSISYLGYSTAEFILDEASSDLIFKLKVDESNISVNPVIVGHPFNSNDVTFNRKEFQLLPGAYEDPSRLLLKAPGFATSNDQANYILYKGFPSSYVNWNINGAAVVNPNHTSNAGSLSDVSSANAGGVNMISGQVIGKYDFQSAPYGLPNNNTLAGSSNIELTDFNNNYLNLSLVGLEAGYGYSGKSVPNFQLNYRYSFVGILTGPLGLDFGGEKINYQDLFAKIDFIKKEDEKLSAFLVLGNSANIHEAVSERDKTSTFKDISDIRFDSNILLSGLNYSKNYKSFNLLSSLNYSQKKDQRFAITRDPDVSSKDNLEQQLLSSIIEINKRWSSSNLGFGLSFNYFNDSRIRKVFNFNENNLRYQNLNVFPFVQYQKESIYYYLEVGTGLSFNNVSNKVLFEPNFKIKRKFLADYRIGLSYRRNSQILSSINFTYDILPKETLGDHLELGLELNKTKLDVFINGFYHHLSKLLVEENSNYSQFTGLDNPFIQNYNYNGKARSYGLSSGLSIRDFLLKNLYLNANTTVFQAEYSTSNDEWLRNTFDFNQSSNLLLSYTLNLTRDRDFVVSISGHQRGGLREFEIEPALSSYSNQVNYDFNSIPKKSLKAYSRIDFRMVYNIRNGSNRRFAQNVSLDIQNLGNRENDAFTNIDFYNGDLFIQKQLGMIPVLAYRIEF